MRILQVISSAAQSGAERHCVDLCGHLRNRGHHVWAAVPADSWLELELREMGIPSLPCRFKRAGGLSSTLALARLAKKEKIQVVHSHLSRATLQCVLASRLAKTGLAATVHIRSVDPAYRLSARQGGRIVAVSEFIKTTLVMGGMPEAAVRVVHNGTDFGRGELTDGKALHRELNLPREAIIAGVVGRIAKDKGQDLALESLVLLKEALPFLHLAFIGRTASEEFEKELTQRASLAGVADRVHFLGSRMDLVPLIDSLDLLLVPSVMESFGLAALEAMTRGKPVLAARVGGLPEVVTDGVTGHLLIRDSAVWAEAIGRLIHDPSRLNQMGQKGRENAESLFSVHKMVAGLEALYNEVAKP